MSNQPFKIRCSAISSIMTSVSLVTIEEVEAAKIELAAAEHIASNKPNKTNAKVVEAAKKRLDKLQHALATQVPIPQGAQTVCRHWKTTQDYGREKLEAYSKYTAKGKAMEGEARKFLSLLDGEFYDENTERKTNEYTTGRCDIIQPRAPFGDVKDIKCSWDCFTFPRYEIEADPKYQWQVLGYMALWGVTTGEVVHILVNAPEEIIVAETYRLAKARGEEYNEDLEEEVRANMTYDNLPTELRIKRFPVTYDPDKIEAVYQRVRDCREYIKTL